MGRKTYTVADLREELKDIDGERTVHIVSQGAIDDLVSVSETTLKWNNGDKEPTVKLEGR